jgi:hypothetical protein
LKNTIRVHSRVATAWIHVASAIHIFGIPINGIVQIALLVSAKMQQFADADHGCNPAVRPTVNLYSPFTFASDACSRVRTMVTRIR